MNFQERLEQVNYEGKIPDFMICPISKKIMNNPVVVVLPDKNLIFDRNSIYSAFEAEDFPSQIQCQGINIPQTSLTGNKCSVLKELIENFVNYKEGKKDRATYIQEKEELLIDTISAKRMEQPCILSSGTICDWRTLRSYCSISPRKNSEGVMLDPMTVTPFTDSDLNTIKQNICDPSLTKLIDQATELWNAATENKIEQMQACIDEDCDLEIPDFFGDSPLLLTIKNGAHDCFELLLKHGARPTDKTLIEAANCRQFSMMRRLIQEGADIHTKDRDGNNLLMIVLIGDNADNEQSLQEVNDTIHFLMEIGVDFRHRGPHGGSLLFMAISSENYQLADELIAKGLDINDKIKIEDGTYDPPIRSGTMLTTIAAMATQAEWSIAAPLSNTIQYMVDNNADLTATNDAGKTALDILREGNRNDLAQIIEDAQIIKPVDAITFNKVRLGLKTSGDTGMKIDDILIELKNLIKYGNNEQAITNMHQKMLNHIITTLSSLGTKTEKQLRNACSKGHELHQVLLRAQANDNFIAPKLNELIKELLNTNADEIKTMMPLKN